jgi:integrase/recombinase XerD
MAKRNEGQVLPCYILWTHSANKAEKHPVKLRLTFQRQTRYYPIQDEKKNVFMAPEEYDYITTTKLDKLRGNNRKLKLTLDGAVSSAEAAIKKATEGKKPFSWSGFERMYLGAEASKTYLAFFQAHIDRLTAKGRAGTVRSYASALNALREFLKGKDIDPAELTKEQLERFDAWLRSKARPLNDTSVGIYMRAVRSVYNEMAASDDYLKAIYPFSRHTHDKGYRIPSGTGTQKGVTLTQGEIEAFVYGQVDGDAIPENPMFRAKQLWLFSFFAQGLNFADMAVMRYSNIEGDTIVLQRAKTANTKKKPAPLRIPLTDPIREILTEQGNPLKKPESFVFGVFDPKIKVTAKQQDAAIRQWIKTTNKWLRRYCEFNGITVVTTYAARHSFASLAKGLMPVVQISRMLGHSNIKTTQVYLGRFEDEQNRESLMKVFGAIRKKTA